MATLADFDAQAATFAALAEVVIASAGEPPQASLNAYIAQQRTLVVPLLQTAVAMVQTAQALIADLEARVAALEGGG